MSDTKSNSNDIVAVGPYSLSKNTYHIVYSDDSSGRINRFTLAIFRAGSEGYDLEFIGDRPFRYSYAPECTFMEFAEACQKYLDGVFYLDQFKTGRC